jgi:predicted nucleic acid-binding protein
MNKQTVYAETSIISYLTNRPSRDTMTRTRQQETQDWWENDRPDFDLFISTHVRREIERGDHEASERRVHVIEGLTVLELNEEIQTLTDTIMASRVLPFKAADDATHIAVAAYYGIDFLLTWNCKHIANATIFRQIREVIEKAGYRCPLMVTPTTLHTKKEEDQ